MKHLRRIVLISFVIAVLNACTAFAITPGFTGWYNLASAPTYYLNGNQVTSSWVKFGNTYYYLNDAGNVVPNFIVNQDGIRYSGITAYLDTNNGGRLETVVPGPVDTYKAVREIYGVTSDYEAFKMRYSGYAQVYGMTDTTYQAYLASYGGQAPGTRYLDAYMNYLNDAYNAHRYNHHYEIMGNGTHKAYCECGAWQIQNCRGEVDNIGEVAYDCRLCGYPVVK